MGGLTLAEFAAMTAKVLVADGIDAYQPTIALIETQQLVVIDGVPSDVTQSDALLDAIAQRDLGQAHFAFGVRTGADITIGLCALGECAFGLISEGANLLSIPAPVWWPARNTPEAP